MRMRFLFQLDTDFQHPCIMIWMIRKKAIAPWPTKNGVTSCPPWGQNIIESKMWLKSKYLRPLRKHRLTQIAMQATGFPARRWPGLVSWQPKNRKVRKTPSIKVLSIAVCCARRLELLSASKSIIVQKIDLDVGKTRSPSKKAWEEAWETGMMLLRISISMKRSRIGSWNTWIIRTKFYTAWPRSPAHIVIWRISRISLLRFKRVMSPLTAIALEVIMIPTSLVKVSGTQEDKLLKQRRWTS